MTWWRGGCLCERVWSCVSLFDKHLDHVTDDTFDSLDQPHYFVPIDSRAPDKISTWIRTIARPSLRRARSPSGSEPRGVSIGLAIVRRLGWGCVGFVVVRKSRVALICR